MKLSFTAFVFSATIMEIFIVPQYAYAAVNLRGTENNVFETSDATNNDVDDDQQQRNLRQKLGQGCSWFKKCGSGLRCGFNFKCHSNQPAQLGEGCSYFHKCDSGLRCGFNFKCYYIHPAGYVIANSVQDVQSLIQGSTTANGYSTTNLRKISVTVGTYYTSFTGKNTSIDIKDKYFELACNAHDGESCVFDASANYGAMFYANQGSGAGALKAVIKGFTFKNADVSKVPTPGLRPYGSILNVQDNEGALAEIEFHSCNFNNNKNTWSATGVMNPYDMYSRAREHGKGGSIYVGGESARLSIYDCVFNGGAAQDGGHIAFNDAHVELYRSSFFGGRATLGSGGSISDRDDGNDTRRVNDGHLGLYECTFKGNDAPGKGDNIHVESGTSISCDATNALCVGLRGGVSGGGVSGGGQGGHPALGGGNAQNYFEETYNQDFESCRSSQESSMCSGFSGIPSSMPSKRLVYTYESTKGWMFDLSNREEFAHLVDPSDSGAVTSSTGSFEFIVKATNDAHIFLDQHSSSQPKYLFVISGWSNTQSRIRNAQTRGDLVGANTPQYLSGSEFRKFRIKWTATTVATDRYIDSTGQWNEFMSTARYTSTNDYFDKVYVWTGYGSDGNWRFISIDVNGT